MNIEAHHARRTCRLFVVALLGVVVLAFVLVLSLVNREAAGKGPHMPANANAQSQ